MLARTLDTNHSEAAPSIVSVADARAAIAACILGDESQQLRIGDITLHSHQRSAVARIRRTISEHGGALLCDDVGLGKTYVALAVAARYEAVTVIAPASLTDMWLHALTLTRISAELVSIESLGRTGPPARRRDLIIVDEAHNFRNTCTRRYSALARLCMLTPVLLLTATPLHNSRDDVAALVALFVGSRAYVMTGAEFLPLIVRRDAATYAGAQNIPIVEHTSPVVVATDAEILDMILTLPPPVPPSDGSVAARLVMHGLVRQWVSSNAALVGALKRRIARSHGLLASLDAGRYPTGAELSAWVYSDDAVQLAFAELLVPATAPLAALSSALREHVSALDRLLAHARTNGDDALAGFVRNVVRAHPAEKIVAFSCYAETAEAIYGVIKRDGHAALLTARGAVIASGPISRAEVLGQFTPDGRRNGRDRLDEHATINFLVATDLLSEGVNLQEASVVIHLDLPWTAARVEQRIGRLARLGSRHDRVVSYTVSPPPRAEAFLRELEIIARKSNLAAQIFGESPIADVTTRSPERASIQRGEHVRATIEKWRCASVDVIDPANGSYVAAFARAARSAALGVWIVDGNATLLSWNDASEVSNDPKVIEAATDLADRAEDATCRNEMVTRLSSILQSADSWYQQRCAWHALGAPDGNVTVPGVHDARRSLARVADAASANAHFARRSHSAALAARLRSAATTPLPLAVEWSLESLTGSPDEATVDTILELVDKARHTGSHVRVKGLRPVALIVMSPAGASK
jgi:superfamily II DNA or RNA helicase